MRNEAEILAIVKLQGLIINCEITTISQVRGLIHSVIMGDISLNDVEMTATQYELEANLDHVTSEQEKEMLR